MNRYHKKVYIPIEDIQRLRAMTDYFNGVTWRYTAHCLKNLKYRTIRQEDILLYVKDLKLNADDIFEYYTDDKNKIIKICYRINYTSNIDLILVLNEFKSIITIYTNDKNDNHETLDPSVYVKDTKV